MSGEMDCSLDISLSDLSLCVRLAILEVVLILGDVVERGGGDINTRFALFSIACVSAQTRRGTHVIQ